MRVVWTRCALNRRKWACIAVVIVALVVSLCYGARWRLYRDQFGEPSWNGRSATWWRHCAAELRVKASDRGPLAMGTAWDKRRIFVGYYERTSVIGRVFEPLDRLLGYDPSIGREQIMDADMDPDSEPVLEALAKDLDPEIRGFAISALSRLAERYPAVKDRALAAIRAALGDEGKLPGREPPVTVRELVSDSLRVAEELQRERQP